VGAAATSKEKEMKSAVCDASVLFKLIVVEPDSHLAESFVISTRILAPDYAFLEVGNALWSRIHSGQSDFLEAKPLLGRLRNFGFETRPTDRFVDRALEIASLIDHPIYDCLYLAMAEAYEVPVVTADKRFVSAVRRSDLASADVRLLAEFG
jgi:predicted nucleic acid-binding protein